MTEYKEVLFKWAEEWVDEGAIVTDVTFNHEEGWRLSSITFQDPYSEIRIIYTVRGNSQVRNIDPSDMPFGTLLSQLFAIADKENDD